MLVIAIEACYGFGFLFIGCEMGQRVNLAFAECSAMAGQFDWYLFPAEIQQMLPLIFKFTQQPVLGVWHVTVEHSNWSVNTYSLVIALNQSIE